MQILMGKDEYEQLLANHAREMQILRAEIAELKEDKRKLESDVADYQHANKHLENDNKDYKIEIAKCSSKISTLQGEVDSARRWSASEVMNNDKACTKALEKMKLEMDGLRSDLSKANAELLKRGKGD